MFPAKLDLSTIRELERCSSRIFAIGAAAFLAGVALSLADLSCLGFGLLVFAGIILLFGMGWMACLVRESSVEVICPHCAAPNEVMTSRSSFRCGSCRECVPVHYVEQTPDERRADTEITSGTS